MRSPVYKTCVSHAAGTWGAETSYDGAAQKFEPMNDYVAAAYFCVAQFMNLKEAQSFRGSDLAGDISRIDPMDSSTWWRLTLSAVGPYDPNASHQYVGTVKKRGYNFEGPTMTSEAAEELIPESISVLLRHLLFRTNQPVGQLMALTFAHVLGASWKDDAGGYLPPQQAHSFVGLVVDRTMTMHEELRGAGAVNGSDPLAVLEPISNTGDVELDLDHDLNADDHAAADQRCSSASDGRQDDTSALVADRLGRLSALLADGVITQAEHDSRRAEILREL